MQFDRSESCEKIVRLAKSFPSLAQAPLEPWNPDKLDRWASKQDNRQLLHAAKFVLTVWLECNVWKVGTFHAVTAFRHWDDSHRQAFLAWCSAPWWH